MNIRHLGVSVFVLFVGLAGCSDPNLQPQSASQSRPQSTNQAADTNTPQTPAIPVHNLSRIGTAKALTPEALASIEVGKTTRAQLVELLGEIKPFTLGDGKQIYRYDIGKFIFGADGVLLRQHISH